MDIKFSFPNPKTDFLVKCYLTLLLTPILLTILLFSLFYYLGDTQSLWDYEGILLLYIWGTLASYFFYFLGVAIAFFIIVYLNEKMMSGIELIKLKEPYIRVKLFFVSIVLCVLTLFLLTWFI